MPERASEIIFLNGDNVADRSLLNPLDGLAHALFEGLHKGNTLARKTVLSRHSEENGGARVGGMNAMSQAGKPLLRATFSGGPQGRVCARVFREHES